MAMCARRRPEQVQQHRLLLDHFVRRGSSAGDLNPEVCSVVVACRSLIVSFMHHKLLSVS